MMNNPTILLTGATGFLGSHLLEALFNCQQKRVLVECRGRSKIG